MRLLMQSFVEDQYSHVFFSDTDNKLLHTQKRSSSTYGPITSIGKIKLC